MTFLKFSIVLVAYSYYVYCRRLPMMALPQIRAEIDLSKDDLGLLVSSQALCFTASKLFFGVASDRVSPLKLLFMGLAGVATTMIGLAYVGSFPQLLLCSLFLGSLQGAGWLPSTRLVAKWFKGGSFATMYSLLGCGSTIAGLLLPATKELYWRTVALCLGCTGTMFCILSYFSLRDNTRQPVVPKTASQQESSIRLILSSKVLWAISLSYIFTLEIRTVCEAWMPVFLNEMNMSAASYIVIYEIGGLLGTLSSGAILNVLATRLPMEKARYRFAIFCSASMLTSIMVSTSFPDYFYFLGFLSGYFVNASLNLWGMIYTQAGEEHLAGSCSAFISFIASLGSVLAGSPLAFLVSNFGYSCFIPFFAVQLVVLAGITSLQLPLRMSEEKKHV